MNQLEIITSAMVSYSNDNIYVSFMARSEYN